MKNNALRIFLVTVFVSVTAFAAEKIEINSSDSKITRPGVAAVWGEWVKDKGHKYDLGLKIKNESDKPMIILLKEMQCFRGDRQGELTYAFFNLGERTIDFAPGQLKGMTFKCAIGGHVEGEFRIVVQNIYENPNGDGKTTGRLMAKDVTWRAKLVD